jgi:hypothetical protein
MTGDAPSAPRGSGASSPRAVLSRLFTGNDHSVYGDSGAEEIRDQTLAPSNYTFDKTAEQAIAVFPDQASAQASAASQIRQWHNCYRHTDADIPPSAAGTTQVGRATAKAESPGPSATSAGTKPQVPAASFNNCLSVIHWSRVRVPPAQLQKADAFRAGTGGRTHNAASALISADSSDRPVTPALTLARYK